MCKYAILGYISNNIRGLLYILMMLQPIWKSINLHIVNRCINVCSKLDIAHNLSNR